MKVRSIVLGIVVCAATFSMVHGQNVFLALKEQGRIVQWRGSVGRASSGDRSSQVVESQNQLTDLWKSWKVNGKVPVIAFEKDFVLVEMNRGIPSVNRFELAKDGDLVVDYVFKPVVSQRLNYLVTSIPREGVRSINGAVLGKKQ